MGDHLAGQPHLHQRAVSGLGKHRRVSEHPSASPRNAALGPNALATTAGCRRRTRSAPAKCLRRRPDVVRLWITTGREIFMFGHNRQLSVALSLASPGLVIREHHSPNEFLSATTWSAERTGPPPRCLLSLVTPRRHRRRGKCGESTHWSTWLISFVPFAFRSERRDTSETSPGPSPWRMGRPSTLGAGQLGESASDVGHVAAHRAGGDHCRRFRAASRLLGVATDSLTVF